MLHHNQQAQARLAAHTLAQTSSLLITARNVPLHKARQISSSLASVLGYDLWRPTHSSPRCGHRTTFPHLGR
eukprot:2060898-Rhodomonas_salina.1